MIDDQGLIELQRILDSIAYGDFQITGKKHNGQVSKLEIPYNQRFKFDFNKAAAYYIDKLREAQMQGLDITFNITTDIKPNGDIYLVDNGFIEKTFKIKP
jgi:hypothetical protein